MSEPLPFVFDDDPCQSAGEGITRTSEPGTHLWLVKISWPGCRPMRCTIRAISRRQAYQFAIARHPHASSINVFSRKITP